MAWPGVDPSGPRYQIVEHQEIVDQLGQAAARMLLMTWDEVDGIMGRAVERGLVRRKSEPLVHIGIDET